MVEAQALRPARGANEAHAAAKRSRISSPEPGRSLGGTVTRVDRPLRQAVASLTSAVTVDSEVARHLFDCTAYGPAASREPDLLRLCWFLTCVALLDAFAARRTRVRALCDALEWFTGDGNLSRRILRCFAAQQLSVASDRLARLTTADELLELLPYALEPHGHISRHDRGKCDVARRTRAMKKSTGVYYTPSDVASFMVHAVASERSDSNATWLDPACGTGAFLRETLRFLAARRGSAPFDALGTVTASIYAIDRSALATDLAAFVLLTECGSLTALRQTPFAAWQTIKGNLVCMDALRFEDCGATLTRYFPRVHPSGFDRVVMNPPYSSFRVDAQHRMLWRSLESCAPGIQVDAHVPFTEMLWKLTCPTGSAAAVLPLSVAANTLNVHRALRAEIVRTPGAREFLCFDREPQALFGEDIKTRNLILIWHKQADGHSSLKTSRLLKWTAQQRPGIFARERLVAIDPSRCVSFIPKLGTAGERKVYEVVRDRTQALVPPCRRMTLGEALQLEGEMAHRVVLVGGTAYNFVNVFFAGALPSSPPMPYSASPVNALTFAARADALAAFALLTSRLCYWLWHVEGDGFHVTAEFLRRLPLWALLEAEDSRQSLAPLGGQLWRAAAGAITGSVNGGKQTYSFHCGYEHWAARRVEQLLTDFYHEETLSECLDQFIDAAVSVDGACRIRSLTRPRRREGAQPPHQGRVEGVHEDGLDDRERRS